MELSKLLSGWIFKTQQSYWTWCSYIQLLIVDVKDLGLPWSISLPTKPYMGTAKFIHPTPIFENWHNFSFWHRKIQQYTNYPTSSPITQLDKRNFELISNFPLSSMSKQGAIIRIDTSDRIKVSLESGLNMQFEFVGRPMAGVAGDEGEVSH